MLVLWPKIYIKEQHVRPMLPTNAKKAPSKDERVVTTSKATKKKKPPKKEKKKRKNI